MTAAAFTGHKSDDFGIGRVRDLDQCRTLREHSRQRLRRGARESDRSASSRKRVST